MPWTFECPKDQSASGVWPDHERERAEAAGKDREWRRCECGALRKLRHLPGTGVTVIPDILEHYNPTIGNGTVVHGRRQLKDLQQQLGIRDYEPSPLMRDRLKESRERALHGRR